MKILNFFLNNESIVQNTVILSFTENNVWISKENCPQDFKTVREISQLSARPQNCPHAGTFNCPRTLSRDCPREFKLSANFQNCPRDFLKSVRETVMYLFVRGQFVQSVRMQVHLTVRGHFLETVRENSNCPRVFKTVREISKLSARFQNYFGQFFKLYFLIII